MSHVSVKIWNVPKPAGYSRTTSHRSSSRRSAAERRSSADLEEMRSAIERMARFTLAVPQGQEADRDFHTALLRAAGNPFIASLPAGIGAAVRTTTVFKQRERPLPRDPVPDHVHVFEAIEAKDVDRADKAMRDLIWLAMRDMGIPRRRKKIDDRTLRRLSDV